MDYQSQINITIVFCWLICLQFLSQEEFEAIRLKQVMAQVEPVKGKKRQLDNTTVEDVHELVTCNTCTVTM